MCYSAMVEQNAKKLAKKFDAQIDLESFAELFEERAKDSSIKINKAMEISFLLDAASIKEKSIGKSIRRWHEIEIIRLGAELMRQTERLSKAEESIRKKETKKALNDIRVATNKISKCKFDIEKHSSDKIVSESEERIFPFHYASVLILDQKGNKTITPMRYHLRPHNEDESFDERRNGCYNARFDNLTNVPFWNDSLVNGRRGILVVKKFYENVPTVNYLSNRKLPAAVTEKENVVVRFEPNGLKEMFVPILWDRWKIKGQKELFSMALITDEPPAEVAAVGHDRCPIFLKKSAIDEWLINKGLKGKEIKEKILSQREHPYYEHEVMGAIA